MPESPVTRAVDARGVATVTLDRPQRNNAYDGDMIAALGAAFDALAADPRVRVVVLRGNGGHFQAGADLDWIERVRRGDRASNVDVSRRTARTIEVLNAFPRPTVALVHGGCYGGGVGVVAACDVVIAEAGAMFSIAEVRWGLDPSIIVPHLNAAIGARQVRRYAITGERFDAKRALALGLVHEVCAPGALDATLAPILDALLVCEPAAQRTTKAHVLACGGFPLPAATLDALIEAHAATRMRPAAEEGLASFREKRDPSWHPGRPGTRREG